MPKWDDPVTKWDDPACGWAGGAVSTATIPTWSDTVGTWADPTQGWNGELVDLAWAAKPGAYVLTPNGLTTGLRVTIVTQGIPGQPANNLTPCMKLVVPPGQDASDIYYDLYPAYAPGWGVLWNRGWTTLAGTPIDDGTTWAGTPAWFTTAGGSVYKRSGREIYRILGSGDATHSCRAHFVDHDWVEADHPIGVGAVSGNSLPAGAYRVRPNFFPTTKGPQGKDPGGSTARQAGVIATSTRTLYRRATFPNVTFSFSGVDVTTFLVRSQPFGGRVWGRVHWRAGANFVLAEFGPVPDNTAVSTAMCNVINNLDTAYGGMRVSSIGGWGSVWPMASGWTLSVEAYSLIGAGSATDPYQQSAQGYTSYAP